MEKFFSHPTTHESGEIRTHSIKPILGGMLILIGLVVLFDQWLNTGWLIYWIIPVFGLAVAIAGYYGHRFSIVSIGCVLLGVGVGGVLAFTTYAQGSVLQKIGIVFVFCALGWLAFVAAGIWLYQHKAWWALIPASLIGSVGISLVLPVEQWWNFVLYPVTGLGLAFLIWGVAERLLGLIIPGSLLVCIGPGIALPWGMYYVPNGLTQAGTMLVWFALGWGLITLFSRALWQKFVWWPLIPGGIFAVVGWGLTIGGNPAMAFSMLSNSGSIGLIIIGLYLLLFRKGMRK